jgi:hypothetical protein
LRRSSNSALTRSTTSPTGAFSTAATLGQPGVLRAQMVQRRLAGQRLDPPHPGGRGAVPQQHQRADVAGARHMGAAAQFQAVGPPVGALARAVQRAHRHHAHLVAVFLAEQRLRAMARASSGVMIRVSTGVFCRMKAFTSASTCASSPAVSALEWLKSKRSRSGAFSDPFCAT